MTDSERRLYIYWRMQPGAGAAALGAARQLQGELRRVHQGLEAALFEREGGDPTMMETYSMAGGVDAALQAAIENRMAPALAAWTVGTRHVEVFVAR